MGLDKQQIGIFRHGKSTYRQHAVPLEDAFDLFPEGIEAVERNSTRFSEYLLRDIPIAVYSSPYGRALHSAKVATANFGDRGFDINPIKIDNNLHEVFFFNWKLFEPLVNGGELEYEGEKLKFDIAKTNPKGLTYQKYLMSGRAQEAAQELRDYLPESYIKTIMEFERFSSIRERASRFLETSAEENPGKNIMAFTHEALVWDILDKFTEKRSHTLEPGNFVHLEKRGNGIYVKSVGDLQGSQEINVLS